MHVCFFLSFFSQTCSHTGELCIISLIRRFETREEQDIPNNTHTPTARLDHVPDDYSGKINGI